VVDANTPLFGGTVTKSASRVYPITGGTLTVTRDGKTAVAADPDRGRIFLANLGTKEVRQVVVDENDEVGRVIEGQSGTMFVVARRSGAVIRVDVAAGTSERFPVCNSPRGIVFDSSQGQVKVACASGLLVTLDAATGAVVNKVSVHSGSGADLVVKDDLRDIVMARDNGGLGLTGSTAPTMVITRFRSAEIMNVNPTTGEVITTTTANPDNFRGRLGPATLAFRAVAKESTGGVVIVHQSSSSTQLGTGLGAYYGGNCGGSVADTFVSEVSSPASSLYATTTALGGATGPLDIAISPNGHRTAIVATGNSWSLASTQSPTTNASVKALQAPRATLQVVESDNTANVAGCWDQQAKTLDEAGEVVAVAFDANNKYIVQYREPAKLILEDQSQIVKEILLSTDSRFDTGLALFQVNSGGGIACASCHPEGGVDGHVWKFNQLGDRVTQPLQGHVSQRAPFHWSGDLANWDNLIDEVMMKRMSMPLKPTADQSQQLLSWLDTIPNPNRPDDLDATAIANGRATFQDPTVGCATCHTGAMLSDNQLHDVGTGGNFITPTLVGVGSRAPLMHNGCAKTLADRFGSCGGGSMHGGTASLSDSQRSDLITYLRSL
jgi:mono/diheme cytochrome c family protein